MVIDIGRWNTSCIQCHTTAGESRATDSGFDSHVAAFGIACESCHLLKAVRSHTIETPSVATSVRTGRPNACNQCHLNKTLEWTAGHLNDWFGQARPRLDADQRTIAASVLWALKGDAAQRALMAWSFGGSAEWLVDGPPTVDGEPPT